MGGAVSVHTHDVTRNELIRHLLESPEAMNRLFEDIAANQDCQEGRINNSDQISLVEIITYFNASTDPCFEGFGAHASIAKQALQYTETHSKKKKRYKDQISHRQFKVFLPTMFLFAHLWRIFESELDNDIDDKRIFKHEFMKSRPSLKKIKGADISDDVTDEMWEAEFSTIDVNKNGFISFAEFCKYVTKFIVTPKEFIKEIMEENHAMYEDTADGIGDTSFEDADAGGEKEEVDGREDAGPLEAAPALEQTEGTVTASEIAATTDAAATPPAAIGSEEAAEAALIEQNSG